MTTSSPSELEPPHPDVRQLRVCERAADRDLDRRVLRALLRPPPGQGAHTRGGGELKDS